MRLLQHVWLLTGLLFFAGWVNAKANMNIWNIDSSCSAYKSSLISFKSDQTQTVQDAFDDALVVAQAALRSLTFVLQRRPNDRKDLDAYLKWVRIAETLQVVLGFYPEPSVERTSDTPGFLKDLIDLFTRMVATLPSSQNDPPSGYQKELWDIPNPKPMITCGERTWKWVGASDAMPHNSILKLEDLDSAKKELEEGAVGAWCLNHRMLFEKKKQSLPNHCKSAAYVDFSRNILAICDGALTKKFVLKRRLSSIKTLKMVQEGHQISEYTNQLGYVILHEMMHWFGGPSKNDDGSWNYREVVVQDQIAVDSDGSLIYDNGHGHELHDTKLTLKERQARRVNPVKTYGLQSIWNLARSHSTPDVKDNSGPLLATKNADSLAMFASMMYFSEYTWAKSGIARKVRLLK